MVDSLQSTEAPAQPLAENCCQLPVRLQIAFPDGRPHATRLLSCCQPCVDLCTQRLLRELSVLLAIPSIYALDDGHTGSPSGSIGLMKSSSAPRDSLSGMSQVPIRARLVLAGIQAPARIGPFGTVIPTICSSSATALYRSEGLRSASTTIPTAFLSGSRAQLPMDWSRCRIEGAGHKNPSRRRRLCPIVFDVL